MVCTLVNLDSMGSDMDGSNLFSASDFCFTPPWKIQYVIKWDPFERRYQTIQMLVNFGGCLISEYIVWVGNIIRQLPSGI